MKTISQWILAASLAVLPSAASAEKYVVWSGDELTADEVQLPTDWYGWWQLVNTTVDDADSAEGKSIKWYSQEATPEASAGIYIGDNGNLFDMSKLAACDLVFNCKVEGTGTWLVRLTAPDTDATLPVTADGTYHEVRLNVQNVYPGVYSTWASGVQNGYVFSLVGSNLSPDAAVFVNDVHYESAVAMPEITAEVGDVTENSAKLTYSVLFPEGYEDVTVTVNGENASATAEMNLVGLEANTQYTYTIVASGKFDGRTYSSEKAVTFKTRRKAGDVPVWYGQIDGTTSYNGENRNIHIDYNVTYNPDKTMSVYAEFDGTEGIDGLANHQLSFVRGLVEEWTFMTQEGEGWVYTTNGTVEEGTEVEFFFWLPYAGGVFGGDYHQVYTAGSENQKPVAAPRIKAEAQNVTSESAEIAYTLTVPSELDGAQIKVYYIVGEAAAVEAAASPISLAGLTENTPYKIEVYAVATLDETTYESKHAEVVFKTPRKDAVDLVYCDYAKAELKNGYFIGEDASMARTHYFSLPWKVTYSADGTAKYEIDLAQCEKLVGFVPQIYWNGFQGLAKNAETGWYEYSFGAQEADAVTAISHYIAYAGGVYDSRSPYTNWGMEKEMPVLGEPANMQVSASKLYVKVEEPVLLSAVVTDAAGYYLPASDVEFTADEPSLSIQNGIATFTKRKGLATVTATVGELSASLIIQAIASPEATDVASKIVGVTDEENVIENTTAANATDGDVNTELRWGCGTTEQHYLVIDLANGTNEGYYVEAVDLLFEGAYATEFTVTLSNEAPAELGASASIRPFITAISDKVFTVKDGNQTRHVLTQLPNGSHRYVTLRTSKALNAAWGIKVKELKVYGTENQPTTTGVEAVEIDNDNAPVEYYNLNGVRVSEPAAGIYIRRQGSNVSKVLVK